ncbi:MAG: 23S rRNA (adenine(2503)-C(2))-methyltransferase RlmN, partial [Acidimicrobiales bacterium]
MSRYELTEGAIAALIPGEPAYRARQIYAGMHGGLRAPEEMTELPASLRATLSASAAFATGFEVAEELSCDRGSTRRFVLRSPLDGAVVETVLMRYSRRVTACVSSQAGCAMGCSFCATGQMGFGRHLSEAEIVEQVIRSARAAAEEGWGRLSNVVFMGMGEPFANYANVLAAVRRCHDTLSMAARSFTISTVGVVPGILRLAAEPLQVNLAVSLHAANDELRSSLVPLNRRYPLAKVMAACSGYTAKTSRRISFEWALISGVNDRDADATALAELLAPLGGLAHVNLIPLNPTPGYSVLGSPPSVVEAFSRSLGAAGVNATIRATRGRQIGGACGQLAGAAAKV